MASKSVGRMCVVAGCSKRQSDGVSVHVFPKDERQRAAWCRFVKLTRADWSGPSNYTVICSDHFNEDCYDIQFSLMKDFGLPTKKRLSHGSIPSIYPKRKRDELNDAFLEPPNPPVRGAHAKRERNRILAEVLRDNTNTAEVQEEAQDQDECVEIQPTPIPEVKSTSMACQTESSRKRSVKIQVAARNKEKGLQVDLQPRVRSIGVQFNGIDDLPAPRPPPLPAPVPDSSSGEESVQTENDTASLYEPSGSSSDDSHVQDINSQAPCNPLEERKFIVSESKLLELFSSCKRCHKYTTASVQQVMGTMVKIAVECEFCGFTWQWSSQPFLGNIPVGNIGLSAAILFSGALVYKVLRVLHCMGVATITRRTFNSHQSAILFPVIARVWDKHQQEYSRRALQRGDPLVIGGDGRADSPGHCAKFGSYSTIDLEEGIVIDIQLVQSNEVKNSMGMEKRGLERTIAWIKDQDLEIGTIVTDRHVQIQKWIRENLTETTHYYDVWHVAKGLKKKILAASKQRDCENLAKWIKSLTNHLYWVAASTPDGNGDFMWAKWESVENHIHNIHEGHNDLFPSCAHDTLEGDEQKKKWIKPGTKASEKISDIILSNQMKKDIPKLSPLHQTSQIEAFHSTINHFAPKMVSFSYHGMYCRLMVAALHFNENSTRMQAVTKEGNLQYKISFPKFKHGEYSVRMKTVESTYGYASALMAETLGYVEASSQTPAPCFPPALCLPQLQPPPLCSAFLHPEKEEAVFHFQSRFGRKETPV